MLDNSLYCSWLYLQFYFKITSKGKKYGDFLLNCTKIPLIVLYWKSWLWVDFKMESVLGYSRKNPNRAVDEDMLFWKRSLEFLDLSISLFRFTNVKFHFFFHWPRGISTFYFFNNPGNSMSSPAPCLDIFWNSPLQINQEKEK